MRSGKANLGVASWAEQVPSAELFISAITIHELEHSVLLMERSDPAQGAVLRAWLDQSVAAAFKSRVLPVDERVARRATALVHDMTVVTRDLKDFQRFDELDVINPWS